MKIFYIICRYRQNHQPQGLDFGLPYFVPVTRIIFTEVLNHLSFRRLISMCPHLHTVLQVRMFNHANNSDGSDDLIKYTCKFFGPLFVMEHCSPSFVTIIGRVFPKLQVSYHASFFSMYFLRPSVQPHSKINISRFWKFTKQVILTTDMMVVLQHRKGSNLSGLLSLGYLQSILSSCSYQRPH